jgi:hypothetical protein
MPQKKPSDTTGDRFRGLPASSAIPPQALIRITVIHMNTCVHLWQYLVGLFSEPEIFQTKFVDRIKTQILCSKTFFRKSCVLRYILRGFTTSDDAFRLPHSIAFCCSIRPFLSLFPSWLCISPPSRFFGDGLVFFLPSGSQ